LTKVCVTIYPRFSLTAFD